MAEYQVVCGRLSQIVFQNEENGYAVIRLTADDGEEITATGCMPALGLGEELTLYGKWITHPSYGEQFTAESFERHLPESVRGIADYLGSGIIKGIGQRLAEKIAHTFGEQTFDILQNEPEKLCEIRGITLKKAKLISQQYIEMSEMRLLMDFLLENGLPVWLTPRLYKRLGIDAMDALSENPYLLCDEYYEIDFALADSLALNLGLSRVSDERIDAGVIYTMTFNLSNGHTFIPIEKLVIAACSLLSDEEAEILPENIVDSINRLEMRAMIVREQIAGRDAVYLRQMYEAEDFLAGVLKDLATKHYKYEFNLEDLFIALSEDSDVEYAPLQKKAIIWAAQYGVSILTGGPGTGKSTTVKGMLKLFESLGLHVVLAAPTGRAAKRLSELCDMEAKTIHRLLEAGYGHGGRLSFQRGLTNPLDCDVVVLDEVSMVDISLMQALVAAMPKGARLVLVGDADQLPPVGPGNFLRDMILSGKVPVTELTEIFRQAQKSDIVMNAHAINSGKMPTASGKDGDFFIMRKADTASVVQTVTELCKNRLPNYYGLNPSQIQVLSPSRRQGAGTMQLNRSLQEALNPESPDKNEKRFGDIVFREGDRVMQIRNNYDIVWERVDGSDQGTGMFNGDVGEILQIFTLQECLIVKFDDKIATYTFDMLDELELAYAMTVHKAQGSEFEAVVVALSSGISKRLLTRNILYTAITRAKKLLVIVGSQETISTMVNTNNKGRRYSALKARMNIEEE
ncbi:MAG TPA: ATP-dependent RecD-like DNA helicase [Candidatus Butyricicoccus avistercoris]|uniref:ATP-dependent RecD2 DNA helicase n=1 Tax=Candidatus Butyricicoccus avistercoris TaxID=2838518 RepID=A0A9D1TIF1_9FIRM|nr:ATP-dependent RecD-like DNA helicase [Candidatus Butyricicoccus avistercoris]